jgi:cytochrome c
LRVWAVVLTHLGALALPALVVWDFALPAWGVQSVAPVTASAVMFGLLWAVALGSGLQLLGGHARRAGLWALVALAALALETNRQQAVRMHAVADRVALVRLEGEQRAAAQKLAQEARYPSNVPLDPQAGERIYAEKCASCHSFNQKVVGPAHKDVVPKYGGDAAKLAAFILNPTKVDPSFPAMPAQGLSRREAQAVAEYLLAKVPAGGGKP